MGLLEFPNEILQQIIQKTLDICEEQDVRNGFIDDNYSTPPIYSSQCIQLILICRRFYELVIPYLYTNCEVAVGYEGVKEEGDGRSVYVHFLNRDCYRDRFRGVEKHGWCVKNLKVTRKGISAEYYREFPKNLVETKLVVSKLVDLVLSFTNLQKLELDRTIYEHVVNIALRASTSLALAPISLYLNIARAALKHCLALKELSMIITYNPEDLERFEKEWQADDVIERNSSLEKLKICLRSQGFKKTMYKPVNEFFTEIVGRTCIGVVEKVRSLWLGYVTEGIVRYGTFNENEDEEHSDFKEHAYIKDKDKRTWENMMKNGWTWEFPAVTELCLFVNDVAEHHFRHQFTFNNERVTKFEMIWVLQYQTVPYGSTETYLKCFPNLEMVSLKGPLNLQWLEAVVAMESHLKSLRKLGVEFYSYDIENVRALLEKYALEKGGEFEILHPEDYMRGWAQMSVQFC
ncbi:hypothetical protein AA313_de0207756 [Arthrobotrys entomopaga]|nr:hypothetical protein AA313_de0207756 [Arthrobotrys entomopaga]